MMTVFIAKNVNPGEELLGTKLDEESSREARDFGLEMLLLDIFHCRYAVRTLENAKLSRTDDLTFVHLVLHRDGVGIQQAGAITLKKLGKTSSVMFYIMQATINYDGAFVPQYCANLVS